MQSKSDIYRFATRNTLLITYSLLPITLNILPLVAQLDNAADSDSEERGFESLQAGQNENPVDICRWDFCFVLFTIHYSIFIIHSTGFSMNNEC